jgi:hypothetical protein
MYHLIDNFTNTKGDALVGYYVKLKVPGGAYATLFADVSSTPIVSVSGIADTAITDANGQFSIYVVDGDYDIEFFDSADVTQRVRTINSVPMYGATLSSAVLLASLAATTGGGLIGSNGPSTVQADITARPTSATLAATGGAALVGSAVRATVEAKIAETISVKDIAYGAVGDGVTDDAAAFTAAIASGSKRIYIPAGTYIINSTLALAVSGLTIYGDGEATILDFGNLTGTGVECIDFTQGNRNIFRDLVIEGTQGTTDAVVFGNTSAASANSFYNVKFIKHRYGVYGLTGVNNRFVNCEWNKCDIAVNQTAQSNNWSFYHAYMLQCKKWLECTNSSAEFFAPSFQALLSSTETYGMLISSSEVTIHGGYLEKDDSAINVALVFDNSTGDTLATSLTWLGGHITPDGNSKIYYSGSPTIQISGMNNSIDPTDDPTNGLIISRINGDNYGLYEPLFAPSSTKTGFIAPKLVQEFSYGKNGTGTGVSYPLADCCVVNGTFFTQTGLTPGAAYTLVFVVKHFTDVRADHRLFVEQLTASVRDERTTIDNLPLDSEGWRVIYYPFVARGDEIQIETVAAELFKIKSVQLYERTVFPDVDANKTEEQFWNSVPTVGTFARGHRFWYSNVTAGSSPGIIARLGGTPGTWEGMAANAITKSTAPTTTYTAPTGGATIDAEARASMAQMKTIIDSIISTRSSSGQSS